MYIPVLRYRLSERGAFKTLAKENVFSTDKIIPLIEVVQHYPTGRIPNIPKSFEQVYTEEFSDCDFPIILDIPMYVDLSVKKIEEKYKRFLYPNKIDIQVRINYLLKLSNNKSIIPVVSYDPKEKYSEGQLTHQRNCFTNRFFSNILCYRIFPNFNNEIYSELKVIVKADDIVLLDLQNKDYKDNTLADQFKLLQQLKTLSNCNIGLINTPIPDSFPSSSISNNMEINKLDNSLIKYYKTLEFDCFGDYAGVKKDLLVESYRGYITNIFYCSSNNKYIGFSAKPSMAPSDFASKIAPSILNSQYWSSHSIRHRKQCPGCSEIASKEGNIEHPGNRSTWKSISIAHYIYSIHELL